MGCRVAIDSNHSLTGIPYERHDDTQTGLSGFPIAICASDQGWIANKWIGGTLYNDTTGESGPVQSSDNISVTGASLNFPSNFTIGDAWHVEEGSAIDGQNIGADERVLAFAQTDARENGPWITGEGSWTRPDDFSFGMEREGVIIPILQGNVWGQKWFSCFAVSSPPITVGTSYINCFSLKKGRIRNVGDSAPVIGELFDGEIVFSIGSYNQLTMNVGGFVYYVDTVVL